MANGGAILYKHEQALRPTSALLLCGSIFGCAVVAFVANAGDSWGIFAFSALAMFGGMGLFSLVSLVRGGSWFLEITETDVRWNGALGRQYAIVHTDVKAFEIVVGEIRYTRVFMNDGRIVLLPHRGDERVMKPILTSLWSFRGETTT
jgi:hypothetical protein